MSRNQTADPSRRHFMTTAASAVAATTILPRHVLGGPGPPLQQPRARLQVGSHLHDPVLLQAPHGEQRTALVEGFGGLLLREDAAVGAVPDLESRKLHIFLRLGFRRRRVLRLAFADILLPLGSSALTRFGLRAGILGFVALLRLGGAQADRDHAAILGPARLRVLNHLE